MYKGGRGEAEADPIYRLIEAEAKPGPMSVWTSPRPEAEDESRPRPDHGQPRPDLDHDSVSVWPRLASDWPRLRLWPVLYSVDRGLIVRTRLRLVSPQYIWPYGPLRAYYPWLIVWMSYETSRGRSRDESHLIDEVRDRQVEDRVCLATASWREGLLAHRHGAVCWLVDRVALSTVGCRRGVPGQVHPNQTSSASPRRSGWVRSGLVSAPPRLRPDLTHPTLPPDPSPK